MIFAVTFKVRMPPCQCTGLNPLLVESIATLTLANHHKKRKFLIRGVIKHPTLDLSSGLNLSVLSSSPVLDSVPGVEPTLKKILNRY